MIIISSPTEPLPAPSSLRQLVPYMVTEAQRIYDAWEQDSSGEDPELGAGGICQDIADGIVGILVQNGIEAASVSAQVGDQHVYVLSKLSDGVYEVDIPPYVYESGAGYVWKKRKDVVFDASMIYIGRISSDPADFENMISE